MHRLTVRLLWLLAVPVVLAACDSGFSGEQGANLPPETELAVRAADLTEVLSDTVAVPGDTLVMGGDTTIVDEFIVDTLRFTSLVEVNWSGTDPDGFVEAYEIRFYDARDTIGDEVGWARTTRRDSLVLLPIPPGSPTANVAFEVRAIDNEGATDPTPARTIFPVRNTPPELRFIRAEAPPDTTWPAASFAFVAEDIDGEANLEAIEVALNDTTAGFVRLPAETDFLTLIAENPRAAETEARLLLGRSGVPSETRLPGFRTDAPNTIYLRAVDAADFRSETAIYPDPDPDAEETWYVQRVTSSVLLANDYRSARYTVVLPYHREILDEYLGADNYDEWYLAEPFQVGESTAVDAFSENFPSSPDPTLRATLEFWDHIYWVSTNVTNRTLGNNLPLAANFLEGFFEAGGTLFVSTAVRIPTAPEDNLGNNALAVLPLTGVFDFNPGSEYEEFFPYFFLSANEAVTPDEPLPTGVTLPALRMTRFIENIFSYPIGTDTVPLYTADFTAELDDGGFAPWPGPGTVASLRADGQVGLFAVPLVNDFNGDPFLVGADGDPEAPRDAVQLILEALDFPR